MTDTTYTFNGMTVNHNGIRVLPDPQPPETAERVSQVILTSGIDIGAEAEKEMSRDTANDQGSEKVVGGGSASAPTSAQSVNEVHAPSGAEWYDREWRAIKEANPEWTDNQVTNKMSEIVWDNNYHALIDEIAHSSSPGERERLIREHQVELDKYRASGIKVDNDITALRNVQGMPSIMMGLNLGEYGQSEQYQKDQAILNEWQRRVDSGERLNIDFDQAYQNEANAAAVRLNLYGGFQVCQKYGFFDNLISQLHADHMRWGYTATLTKQDQANGYRLDYFSDVDAYLRVRSADNIHPDDLIKYHEHLRGAESATNSVLAGIGKASADITNGTIAGTLGLGEPDGSGWTQFGYHLTKDAPKIDLAVSTLWGGYGLSKILRFGGQRAVLSSESSGDKIGNEGLGKANSGLVEVKPPPNATPEQIEQVKKYVEGANKALKDGALSPTGRVSTKGELRQQASKTAQKERQRAAEEGTPYEGHVGHVPDTTWTGAPEPHSWLDLDPSVNTSLGGQTNKYPIGYIPTEFKYKGE